MADNGDNGSNIVTIVAVIVIVIFAGLALNYFFKNDMRTDVNKTTTTIETPASGQTTGQPTSNDQPAKTSN